jgi:hypothetical protein
MPPEGPNKSEELLKRYAKERQEQSPNLPLHPATRRLLQGEVARQFGKKSALENRGWPAWFGVMRGRLAIGTALGAVVVTGVCVWWNNQGPQTLEMAKAEPSAKELAPRPRPSSGEASLKSEAQIALLNATARVQLEDEARGRAPAAPLAPAAPAERASRPDSKEARAGGAAAAPGTGSLAFNGPAIAATSTFSFENSFGRGMDKSENLGIVLEATTSTDGALATTAAPLAKLDLDGISPSSSVTRMQYAGAATSPKDMTNRTDLALAYHLPGTGLGSAPASSPAATFGLGDNERKNLSLLPDAAKLAEERLPLARTESETVNRSRRASLEVQALATQPQIATAQPRRTLGESVAADKPQQPSAPSQLAGNLGAQASATRPEPNEAARYLRLPALTAAEDTKQKVWRELDRLDAEPAVLNRFVIEQQGNSVRVVEADGSVYDGNVEEPVVTEFDADVPEAFAEKKDQLAREKPVALKSAIAPPTDGYSFRAAGSNVTLRQMVVVNGRFAAATNTSARGAGMGGAGGLSSLTRTTPAPTRASITTNRANGQRPAFGGRYGLATNQPATIEGTVRIGVTNQQWFRAVRDPR